MGIRSSWGTRHPRSVLLHQRSLFSTCSLVLSCCHHHCGLASLFLLMIGGPMCFMLIRLLLRRTKGVCSCGVAMPGKEALPKVRLTTKKNQRYFVYCCLFTTCMYVCMYMCMYACCASGRDAELASELKWRGVPGGYQCSSVSLATHHGYLVFRKRQ